MWLLYQLAMAALLAVAAPVLIARRGRHYLATLPGRLGRYGGGVSTSPPGRLWIHAVSVGEVSVAATLARSLPQDLPLVVTTVTPTGQERARKLFAARAEVAYLPFDLGFAVGRFFRRFDPAALLLVEGDYWPLVLREARRRGLPVAVINARVSDRGLPRLRPFRLLLPHFYYRAVGRFGAQTEEDGRRLVSLGIEGGRVTVTGNLKFESPEPPLLPELETEVERLAGGRPVLVAGSTMPGEEAQVLDAHERLGGGERALLAIAPRHPERFPETDRLLAERGIAHARRSEPGGDGRPAVLLVDTLGELASLYRHARAAFVGGTLAPTGGHNPLEPARFGVPVAVGPSMENFKEMAETFDAEGAWARVGSAAELAEVWGRWLEEPEAAREVGRRGAVLVEANRGALERTLELVAPLLEATARGGER